jgi:hypothetical protein
MRVLIVSWYLPPFNTMGALRVGKFAKYLYARGHDVRVLSCRDLPFDRTLPLELPEDRVVRSRWVNVLDLPRAVQSWRKRRRGWVAPPRQARDEVGSGALARPSSDAARRLSATDRLLRAVRDAYIRLVRFPDDAIGWYPYGVGEGRTLLKTWRPEIVFASAPPFTTLLIGRRLARIAGVPWVAEYRDRFLEDPYVRRGAFRLWRARFVEDRWLGSVAGIVTVSEPWAEDYRKRRGVPVATVLNGFDPDDFPADYARDAPPDAALRIVYTGILYPERRDPSPLFAAIARLGPDRDKVLVEFFGADAAVLGAMARRHGVADRVRASARVPYRQSIALQMNADVLLLLQWNDAREAGNVPGKLFEYLGARRPVLGIGLEDGVPARILRERGAGVVVNDPAAIARQLGAWIEEKRARGAIALLPMKARAGLSREDQYAIAERFLIERAGAGA